MLDCLILGDSIAVGTKMFAPPACVAYAHGGWNSWQWNRTYLSNDLAANTVIISLGTNDHKYIKTEFELRRLRDKVVGKKVFWILPHANNPKSGVTIEFIDGIVRKIAQEHGDYVIPITHVQPDNIHPSWRGYKEIVAEAH
jgi:lysophospholipase L1-like esterase